MPPSVDGHRFCAVSDALGVGEVLLKWPNPHVTWTIKRVHPAFSPDEYRDAIAEAWAGWERVCGIKPEFVAGAPFANLVVDLQTIGPGGVLADCQLPPPGLSSNNISLLMRIDSADAYVAAENPPQGKLDLVRVVRHELGHGLGLGHAAPNSGDLMAPTYSVSVRDCQRGDKIEGLSRYPVLVPIPPPSPGVPGTDRQVATVWARADGTMIWRPV